MWPVRCSSSVRSGGRGSAAGRAAAQVGVDQHAVLCLAARPGAGLGGAVALHHRHRLVADAVRVGVVLAGHGPRRGALAAGARAAHASGREVEGRGVRAMRRVVAAAQHAAGRRGRLMDRRDRRGPHRRPAGRGPWRRDRLRSHRPALGPAWRDPSPRGPCRAWRPRPTRHRRGLRGRRRHGPCPCPPSCGAPALRSAGTAAAMPGRGASVPRA